MKSFYQNLLGTNDLGTYAAALLFALIGVLMVQLIKARSRDKHSNKTPYSFSFKFMIQDNLREIIIGILLILLSLRFSMEYAGEELTMYYALGVGLGNQSLATWLSSIEIKARK